MLVCTYNELANLPRLVGEVLGNNSQHEILIVDDGSPDKTGDWAFEESTKNSRVKLIQRGAKLGLGSAIKTGLNFAIENDFDYVVNLDADFSHDPRAIEALIQATIAEQADLTIGSRYVEGGGLTNCSFRRIAVSRAANLCARVLVGWKVRDCSSAYRCYRLDFLKRIELDKIICTGYGFLEELLWEVLHRGGKVIERPIIYTEREHGESKISIKEAYGTLKVLCRLALRR